MRLEVLFDVECYINKKIRKEIESRKKKRIDYNYEESEETMFNGETNVNHLLRL